MNIQPRSRERCGMSVKSTTSVALHAHALHQRIIELEQELEVVRQRERTLRVREEALVLSRHIFQDVYDNVSHGLAIIQKSRVVYVNASLAMMIGQKIEDVLTWSIDEIVACLHCEDQSNFLDVLHHHTHQASVSPFLELRVIGKDGQIRWVQACVTVIVYQGDRAQQIIYLDITDKKIQEQRVHKNEETFRLFAECTYNWEYWIGPDGKYVYVSPSCERITGYSARAFMENPNLLISIIHPDDYKYVARHFSDMQKERSVDSFDYGYGFGLAFRIVTASGDIRWIGHVFQPVYGDDGRWLGHRVSNRDITERIEAEDALRASEEKFRLLVEHAHDIIYRYRLHPVRGYEYISPSVETITGYSQDDYYRDPDLDLKLIHSGKNLLFDSLSRTLSSDSTHEPIVLPLTRKDGKKIWVEQRHWLVWNKQGEVVAIEGITRDITARKHTEEILRKSKDALLETHKQLNMWVTELQQHNMDATMLHGMGEFLQRCESVDDVYKVVARFAVRIFYGMQGALYMLNPAQAIFEHVVSWGDNQSRPIQQSFDTDACQAVMNKRLFVNRDISAWQYCSHTDATSIAAHVCVPLIIDNEVSGTLYLQSHEVMNDHDHDRISWLAVMIARHTSLILANLHVRQKLYNQSIRDPLTNLFNRRYMSEMLEREIGKATRHQESIGVMMIDVDYFKDYNDTYGHDAGDEVLRKIGIFLQAFIRAEDIACRYGGEEFTLILPGASLDNTIRRAEELRASIERLPISQHSNDMFQTVTISIGVASFPCHGVAIHKIIDAADKALYRAKDQGRNCVVVSDGSCDHDTIELTTEQL